MHFCDFTTPPPTPNPISLPLFPQNLDFRFSYFEIYYVHVFGFLDFHFLNFQILDFQMIRRFVSRFSDFQILKKKSAYLLKFSMFCIWIERKDPQ